MKANVWKSMFVVAFWAGTGAVIVLVLMGKKGCPEIEVVEKKTHRNLGCVDDGVEKELGICRCSQDVSQ